jgi:hypothetical protein
MRATGYMPAPSDASPELHSRPDRAIIRASQTSGSLVASPRSYCSPDKAQTLRRRRGVLTKRPARHVRLVGRALLAAALDRRPAGMMTAILVPYVGFTTSWSSACHRFSLFTSRPLFLLSSLHLARPAKPCRRLLLPHY